MAKIDSVIVLSFGLSRLGEPAQAELIHSSSHPSIFQLQVFVLLYRQQALFLSSFTLPGHTVLILYMETYLFTKVIMAKPSILM